MTLRMGAGEGKQTVLMKQTSEHLDPTPLPPPHIALPNLHLATFLSPPIVGGNYSKTNLVQCFVE